MVGAGAGSIPTSLIKTKERDIKLQIIKDDNNRVIQIIRDVHNDGRADNETFEYNSDNIVCKNVVEVDGMMFAWIFENEKLIVNNKEKTEEEAQWWIKAMTAEKISKLYDKPDIKLIDTDTLRLHMETADYYFQKWVKETENYTGDDNLITDNLVKSQQYRKLVEDALVVAKEAVNN